jgi:Phosphotransferase enzyme family
MNSLTKAENDRVSITDLPAILINLFARGHYSLLPESQGPLGLFVRYLRRKPQRGLAIIYAVDETHPAKHVRTNNPTRSVSLTIDEEALDGARIRFKDSQTQQAQLDILPSGVLYLPELHLFAQKFPADAYLTTLAACCDTTPQGPLFLALQDAAQKQLKDSSWRLLSAQAIPVRYKPANRCVIRYNLQLERPNPPHSPDVQQKFLRLFGKTYANPVSAHHTQRLQQQLYQEQLHDNSGAPILPAPLGMIDDLALTLNEAIEIPQTNDQDERWGTLRTGIRALQPRFEKGKGGAITRIVLPEEELRLTAQVLARLHTSTLRPDEDKPRTGAKEAKRARERARLIAEHTSDLRAIILPLAEQLAEKLAAQKPITYRVAHGGFKASQLLLHSHNVFVVDFDGVCLADPALDVGYFLAYLRPSGLWYEHSGMRQWFDGAAEIFQSEYQKAMLAAGVTADEIADILARTRFYEAALIFKIAARRANRLNSPRSGELSAMLSEIAHCLSTIPLE